METPASVSIFRAVAQPRKGRYRPEIDGLRAFAVIAVIINHVNKDLLPNGYLGVDIFFVISGYVITSSLAGRESRNFFDFLAGFYERRIKRLVPALVVFVMVTTVFTVLLTPNPGSAIKTGVASVFGISNLYLYKQSTDYFAQSTEINPFTHTWSLGVEEQFYLLFPLLVWFSGFGQEKENGARNLFFCVGFLTVASLLSFVYIYQVNQPAAYFLMPTRFWEMAVGCLIFIVRHKRARIEHLLEQVPPLLVVAVLVGLMFMPLEVAVSATIGVVALSAVLIACLKEGTAAYKFFTLEQVVYTGLISYSLYLWHWGVLWLSRLTIGIHWWSLPFQIGLMLILAATSFARIEQRYRFEAQVPARTRVFVVGATAVGTSALISMALLSNSSRLYTGTREGKQTLLSQNGILRQACSDAFRLLVIGDSHAGHIAQAKDYACKKYNINIQVFSEGGMPFPTLIYSNSFHGASRQDKIMQSIKLDEQWASAAIPAAGEGVVMLSNRSLVYFDHGNSDDNKNSVPVRYSKSDPSKIISENQSFADWKRDLSGLLQKHPNTTFIYALPNPEFRNLSTIAPLCRKEWFRPFPSEYCFAAGMRLEQAKKHRKFKSEIIKISERRHNLIVFDYFDLVCPNSSSSCSVMSAEGLPLYRDSDHFTEHGAEKFLQRLAAFLSYKGIMAN